MLNLLHSTPLLAAELKSYVTPHLFFFLPGSQLSHSVCTGHEDGSSCTALLLHLFLS